ncbi:hypothetical protein BS78_08G029900 [Paspalum vaginatum]|nr:hypothetical protein BS78_08G029900 [Paspalum vaginatum]
MSSIPRTDKERENAGAAVRATVGPLQHSPSSPTAERWRREGWHPPRLAVGGGLDPAASRGSGGEEGSKWKRERWWISHRCRRGKGSEWGGEGGIRAERGGRGDQGGGGTDQAATEVGEPGEARNLTMVGGSGRRGGREDAGVGEGGGERRGRAADEGDGRCRRGKLPSSRSGHGGGGDRKGWWRLRIWGWRWRWRVVWRFSHRYGPPHAQPATARPQRHHRQCEERHRGLGDAGLMNQ